MIRHLSCNKAYQGSNDLDSRAGEQDQVARNALRVVDAVGLWANSKAAVLG
jgi:hypothetical protein